MVCFWMLQHDFKVAVGPNLSTKRNLKQIISTECTKTVIFQLLWPLDNSKLVERESLYNNHTVYLFLSRSNYIGNNMARNRKEALQCDNKLIACQFC